MIFQRSLFKRIFTKVFALSLIFSIIQLGQVLHAENFIHPEQYNLTSILPPPPQPGSEAYRIDTGALKNSRASSTQEQINAAIAASHDSVFDYSQSLGPWFNAKNLPKTAALFAKVDEDTKKAIVVAKKFYTRERPIYWYETGKTDAKKGYSYPSGHTTRAYVWASLLSYALPANRPEIHQQARQKAWYRVILGRHFPADVRAGKIYGQFLAKQFLQSPSFREAWADVTIEIKEASKSHAAAH